MDYLISDRVPGTRRTPGVVECMYIEKSRLETIAVPAANPGTIAAKVTIVGAHVPTGTNGFRKMYLQPKKSELKGKSAGDIDSKSVDIVLEGFIPGMYEELAAFLLDDPELIILVPNGPCGTSQYLQLGTKCDGAYVTEHEYTSGIFGGNTAKGFKVMISAQQSSYLFYNSAIPLPTE